MKFWHSNRLDQEAEYDPADVARRFIAAVRDGYDLTPCRLSGEFAFRWWLTDGEAFNATWEEQDSDALMDALRDTMTGEDKQVLWEALESPETKALNRIGARAAN
jgi:hypothetical protein